MTGPGGAQLPGAPIYSVRVLNNAACAGLSPAQIIQKLRSDAAARAASYGFAEDASSASTKYYGHLIYAGGY